jgi:hypothetical protein
MLLIWLLLWPGLCGASMAWTIVCLPMLASMVHLWATTHGISPVTSALCQHLSKRALRVHKITKGHIGSTWPAREEHSFTHKPKNKLAQPEAHEDC